MRHDLECGVTKNLPNFKGVAKLILESPVPPLVLPVYHKGLGHIFPLRGAPFFGWLPRVGQPLEIAIGDAVDTTPWRDQLAKANFSVELSRQIIAEHLRTIMNQVARKGTQKDDLLAL